MSGVTADQFVLWVVAWLEDELGQRGLPVPEAQVQTIRTLAGRLPSEHRFVSYPDGAHIDEEGVLMLHWQLPGECVAVKINSGGELKWARAPVRVLPRFLRFGPP